MVKQIKETIRDWSPLKKWVMGILGVLLGYSILYSAGWVIAGTSKAYVNNDKICAIEKKVENAAVLKLASDLKTSESMEKFKDNLADVRVEIGKIQTDTKYIIKSLDELKKKKGD